MLEQAEDLGGYVYEMMYLSFRVRPESHLVGEDLEWFFESELNPKVEAIREMMEPDFEDYLAHRDAVEAFERFEAYGLPRGGGYLDQKLEWLEVMDCVRVARDRAESLTQREEAWHGKQKADRASQEQASA